MAMEALNFVVARGGCPCRPAISWASGHCALRGVVMLWDAAAGRYDVRIEDAPHAGELISVRPSKLSAMEQ